MKALALVVIVLGLLPASLPGQEAGTHFWIIGGGPKPSASEAQIELNVNWVLGTLADLRPDAVVRVFFADGRASTPSVVELRPPTDAAPLRPLVRVFGDPRTAGLTFRLHRVSDVAGSTSAETLIPELREQFRNLEQGDVGLILYNGHGTWNADRSQNALRLWGESRLTAQEFEHLLSEVDPSVPIRFIFTQCFSGAFARAVHPDAASVTELAAGRRCGFLAESENRESEGCSPSVEIGDYRDYTTYLFAALGGRTRLGEPLATNPDLNGDGQVSLFEAHLYALAEAHSGDLPRSTSEVYLERWEPWYARWLPSSRLPDNEYALVSRRLSHRLGLPEDERGLGGQLHQRHDALTQEIEALGREQQALESDMASIRQRIREAVVERWPRASQPYTEQYLVFVEQEAHSAEEYLTQRSDYGELVASQDRLAEIEVELMNRERDLTQLERIRRVRRLAHLLHRFERLASESHQAAYWQLRACEELPL